MYLSARLFFFRLFCFVWATIVVTNLTARMHFEILPICHNITVKLYSDLAISHVKRVAGATDVYFYSGGADLYRGGLRTIFQKVLSAAADTADF